MIDAVATIKSALASQQDPYAELAKAMFNTEQPTKEQRREAKSLYWSYMYTGAVGWQYSD